MDRKKIREGKTKILWKTEDEEDMRLCVVESKDDITAHDDATFTRRFGTKAIAATATTCNVFKLLADAGIPVAYERTLSPTEFLAQNCEMIPLECVARRYAVGSYLKRFPQCARVGDQPLRFHALETEYFLKTTGGVITALDGKEIGRMGEDPEKPGRPIEDPLILDPFSLSGKTRLSHPKLPTRDKRSVIAADIDFSQVLPGERTMREIEEWTRKVFLVLERAWGMLGCRLVDMKIEFGINKDGKLLVADVVDNDSWRLRTAENRELSKELFRQGNALAEVEDAYALVARLTERFRIPNQAIVCWKASVNDALPDWKGLIPSGVRLEEICGSGHKATQACLDRLNEVQADYPNGGVLVTFVGRSNGLAPILAAHTSWEVIAVCKTLQEAYSVLDMPSAVPVSVVLDSGNALLLALRSLAHLNPAAYAQLQFAMEKLDLPGKCVRTAPQ